MEKVKNILIIVLISLILIGIAIFVGFRIGKKKATDVIELPTGETVETEEVVINEEVTVDTSTIKEIVSPASELVTYKYYYTDAGTYEKDKKFGDTDIVIPFSTDKTVYTYSGTISAGIDTGEITYDIDNEKKKIIVHLPNPKILSHELDENSFQTYDVKKSIFTSSSLNDYAEFVGELKTKEEQNLNDKSEFWTSLRKNTEGIVSGLMTADERLNEYTITYDWAENNQ